MVFIANAANERISRMTSIFSIKQVIFTLLLTSTIIIIDGYDGYPIFYTYSRHSIYPRSFALKLSGG